MNILFIYSRDISLDDSGGARTVIMLIRHLSQKSDVRCYTLFNIAGIELPKITVIAKEGSLEKQIRETITERNIDILMVPEAVELYDVAAKATAGTSCNIVSALHNMPGYEKKNLHILLLESLFYNESLIKRLRALVSLILFPFFYVLYVMKEKLRFHNAYMCSDYVVLLSERFYDSFIKEYYIKDNGIKLRAVGNGLSFAVFASEEDILNKKKQIVVVSRFDERQKRLSRVFKVWRDILNTNTDWKLVVVGFGRSETYYRNLVKKYKLSQIEFVGRQDPQKYYLESPIFLMTSDYEGWGMTITEAQQCGCVPIVLDTYESLHDLIQSSVNGYIVKDLPEMTEKTLKLMNDKELRSSLAVYGVLSCKKYLPENVYEGYYNIFREIIDNSHKK